jgi:hypothetical protein
MWNKKAVGRDAELQLATGRVTRSLSLQTDGHRHWRQGDGRALHELDGCLDIDIWPTPFTQLLPKPAFILPVVRDASEAAQSRGTAVSTNSRLTPTPSPCRQPPARPIYSWQAPDGDEFRRSRRYQW